MKASAWRAGQADCDAQRASPAHGGHTACALWRRLGAARGNRRDFGAEAGRASELGRGEGAGAVRSAGLASADGLEVRRWPVK